ncbi:hypothetical protein [Pontibacter liquoris]|nr:hypothetical protein [Pontibacter liquoris]
MKKSLLPSITGSIKKHQTALTKYTSKYKPETQPAAIKHHQNKNSHTL